MKIYFGPYKNKRTLNVEIHEWDTFDVSTTLAEIIHPLLVKFKEETSSYPFRAESLSKWQNILDKMIFSFENLKENSNWEEQFENGVSDYEFVPNEDGTYTMVQGPNHTFKEDKEGKVKYRERIQGGLELFSKHYTSLWS